MKTLVCGSRNHSHHIWIWEKIDEVHAITPITLIVTGAATGADAAGELWAKRNYIPYHGYPAKWHDKRRELQFDQSTFNKAAGPIRNRYMYDQEKPEMCLAFPLLGSKGTWDMVRVCRDNGLEPIVFEFK